MGALFALVTITGLVGLVGLLIHLICRYVGGPWPWPWTWTWTRAWLSAPKEETMKISKCSRPFHPNGFMIPSDSDLNLSGGGSFRRFDKTDPDRDYQLLRQGSTVSIPPQAASSVIPPQPLRPAPVLPPNVHKNNNLEEQGSVDSVFADEPPLVNPTNSNPNSNSNSNSYHLPTAPKIPPPPPTTTTNSQQQSFSHNRASLPPTFSMTNPFLPLFQASTQFFSQTLQGLQSFQNAGSTGQGNGNGDESSSSSSRFQFGQEEIRHHSSYISSTSSSRTAGLSMGELLFSSPPPVPPPSTLLEGGGENGNNDKNGGGLHQPPDVDEQGKSTTGQSGGGGGLIDFFGGSSSINTNTTPAGSTTLLPSSEADTSPTSMSMSTSVKLDSSNPFSPQSISSSSPTDQVIVDLQPQPPGEPPLFTPAKLNEREHDIDIDIDLLKEDERSIISESGSGSGPGSDRVKSGHSIFSWSANQGEVSAGDDRAKKTSRILIENEKVDNNHWTNNSTTTTSRANLIYDSNVNQEVNQGHVDNIYDKTLNGNSIFDQIRDFNELSMMKNEETVPSPAPSSTPLVSFDDDHSEDHSKNGGKYTAFSSRNSNSTHPIMMSLDSPLGQIRDNNNIIFHSSSSSQAPPPLQPQFSLEERRIAGESSLDKPNQNPPPSPLSFICSPSPTAVVTTTSTSLSSSLVNDFGPKKNSTSNSTILSDLTTSTATSISSGGHYPNLSAYRNARSFSLRQTSTDSLGSESDLASPDGLPSLQRAMSCDSVSSDTSIVLGELDNNQPLHLAGHLCVGLEYDSESADLLVNVMEAKEINGLHPESTAFDSYVRVFLLPDKTTNMQTRVYRKSLNPIYKEKFMFGLELGEFPLRTLVFYMYATDKFSNTLIGEGELKLADLDVHQLPSITWIPLTDTGQRGGDFGEIMFSLSYLPTAERLTVVVVKARNLKFHRETVGDPFVKVYLLQRGKKVSKKKSSTKKGEKNPIFNEAMIFSVPAHSLQTIQLRITVADSSHAESNRAYSLGHVIVGSIATGKPLSHWNQMLSSLRKPIAMWHSLRK